MMDAVEATVAVRMTRAAAALTSHPTAHLTAHLVAAPADGPASPPRSPPRSPAAGARRCEKAGLAVTPFASRVAENPEQLAEHANWAVLASVLYPPRDYASTGCGAAAFAHLKKKQWRSEQHASKMCGYVRRWLLNRRVARRVHAKRDAAARVVQFHYRHKLSLGAGGQARVLAARPQP